ncbi:MAG: hypothetical protein WBM13_10665, partial [Bacteroidia bacterium]
MLDSIKLILFLLVTSFCVSAQNDSVAFYHGYEFDEGLYLNIQQFKSNSPISKQAIISQLNKNDIDFFSQLIEQKQIVYKTENGEEKTISPQSLWGYCQNRGIYVFFNSAFHRLNAIGSICHFSANITVTVAYANPMMMNASMQELRQFVFSIKLPQIVEFNANNTMKLIKDDNELYTQFMALKKRKREDAV